MDMDKKGCAGNGRTDNNNGNERERGEKNQRLKIVLLYGAFAVKNEHGISGLLGNSSFFFLHGMREYFNRESKWAQRRQRQHHAQVGKETISGFGGVLHRLGACGCRLQMRTRAQGALGDRGKCW